MNTAASFWLAAEQEPARLALIEPNGRRWTAGALAARCHPVVHALRARGLGHGDAVAVLLPNGEPLVATLLAVMQAGWHWVPINTSLTASEVAWILRGLGRARLRRARAIRGGGGSRGATRPACRRRAHRGGRRARLRTPSTRCSRASRRRGPRTASPDSSCSTPRAPRGARRRCSARRPPSIPTRWPRCSRRTSARYDITPGGDHVHLVTSPMYHMAPLSFGYFSLHFGHAVVLMDRFEPETGARAHRAPSRHHHAHGADAAPSPDVAARGDAPRTRRLFAPARDACRRAVPGRAEAQADRMARAGGLRVLRRLRGRRHDGARRGVARAARHRRPALARRGRARARRRGQGLAARRGRHGLPEADDGLRVQGRPGQDAGVAARRVVHGRRHGLARRGRLPVPLRSQDRHDHHGRRERVSGRDRGRAARAPRGRRRGGVRRAERGVGRRGEGGGRAGARRPRRTKRSASGCSRIAARAWPATSARARSTSRARCRATRTASSTSASCATRTGSGASGRSEDRCESSRTCSRTTAAGPPS